MYCFQGTCSKLKVVCLFQFCSNIFRIVQHVKLKELKELKLFVVFARKILPPKHSCFFMYWQRHPREVRESSFILFGSATMARVPDQSCFAGRVYCYCTTGEGTLFEQKFLSLWLQIQLFILVAQSVRLYVTELLIVYAVLYPCFALFCIHDKLV